MRVALTRKPLRAILFSALGIALAIAVVWRYDAREVWSTASSAGAGALVYAGVHAVPLFFDTLGWRALIPSELRPPMLELYLIRWTGESINNVLPLAVAGDVARASLVPGSGAATAADLSVGLAAQGAVALFGAAWIALRWKVAPRELAMILAGALAVVLLSIALQRSRWFRKKFAIGAGVRGSALARGALFRTLSTLCGGVEVWIGLFVLGRSIALADCVAFFAIATVARAVAFVLPAGLGVQEWSFVVLGGVFGVPPETALALALLRRMREAMLGVPGVIAAWIVSERSRARSRSASSLRPGFETDPKGT